VVEPNQVRSKKGKEGSDLLEVNEVVDLLSFCCIQSSCEGVPEEES